MRERAAFEPIRTAHLLLRPLQRDDAAAMFRYRADPEVARYQSWRPRSLAEIKRFIERNAAQAALAPDTWYQIGISAPDGTLAGDIGIHVTDEGRQVELGKHRVFASVDPRNHRSVALMERLRFRAEGHFRSSLYIDHEWVDDLVFAMLQAEWLSRTAARHGEPG